MALHMVKYKVLNNTTNALLQSRTYKPVYRYGS
jgi:hypothetical protein